MPKRPDPDDLVTIKGVIRFAKEHHIARFKFRDFEFDLTGFDPQRKSVQKLEQKVKVLDEKITQVHNRLEMEKGLKKR